MAGPLDELVSRILRRVDAFKEEHSLEDVEVSIELVDGSLHRLQTLSSEPGFGFVSFRPHAADEPGNWKKALRAEQRAELVCRDHESDYVDGREPPLEHHPGEPVVGRPVVGRVEPVHGRSLPEDAR